MIGVIDNEIVKSDYSKYSQYMFNKDIENIFNQIKKYEHHYDCVVGIKRGGLIPAVCLSHKLDLPLTVWDVEDPLPWDHFCGAAPLFVDDILDTGKTMEPILRGGGHLAVLIWNVNQSITPEYYGRRIDRRFEPEWIDFWWEK